ncbi:hypothetical protein RYX36_024692 [Vicia faba]
MMHEAIDKKLYLDMLRLFAHGIWSDYKSKNVLLEPGNSMEHYRQKMKLNIDDNVHCQKSYFLCENKGFKIENWSYVSF